MIRMISHKIFNNAITRYYIIYIIIPLHDLDKDEQVVTNVTCSFEIM